MHVAFDIGNVLVRFHSSNFIGALCEQGLSVQQARLFLEYQQPLQDLGITNIMQALRVWFRSPTPFEYLIDLERAWLQTLEPNEMMLNFLANLRNEGVKIALLSNIGVDHAALLRSKVPELFIDAIDHFSCEVGARKPSRVYYQSFLMDYPAWTGSVYVDDLDENLQAGKKYSFKTFKFNLEQILQLPQSKQKIELDKIKSYVLDRKYDGQHWPESSIKTILNS